MTRLSTTLAVLVTLAGTSAPARAQTPQSPPTEATPWDLAVVGGFFGGRPDLPETTGYQQHLCRTGQAALVVGRYLAPHVKAELELSTTGQGRQFIQRYATFPNSPPIPYGAERRSTMRSLSASVVWQFRDNEWIHPFVHAGVTTDVNRVTTHTWQQTLYPADPRTGPRGMIGESTERTSVTAARLLVGGGTKVYITPRSFLRADARLAAGREGHHVAFRIGFGAEF